MGYKRKYGETRELIDIKHIEKETWTNYIKLEYNKVEQTLETTEETKRIVQAP